MYYTDPSEGLWAHELLGMEHSLTHSRCSLSGDVVMKGFMTKVVGESMGFMQERSERWSVQIASLAFLENSRKFSCWNNDF